MQWKGETEKQWSARVRKWHQVYCWLPTQMLEGDWVWLEYVWCKAEPTVKGGLRFDYTKTPEAHPDQRVRPPDQQVKLSKPMEKD